jgi:hypothetical protein
MSRHRWWLISAAAIVAIWASAALGSYVYLHGMGYGESFEFPWLQLWIAIPYIYDDGWHGISTLKTWNWCLTGVVFSVGPGLLIGILTIRRWFDRRRQPAIYGDTGFANPREMRSGGITSSKDAF